MSATVPPSASPARPWAVALVLLAAVLATFGRILPHELFESFDDDLHITINGRLTPPSLEAAAWFWIHPYADMYVPVSYSFWMLEAQLAGGGHLRRRDMDARVFRAGSLALHLAAAFLVYRILRRLLEGELPAAAGALLFALHPLQVESVAWVSETRGLLAAVFGLGALALHAGTPLSGGRARRALALASLALALLAKPSAASVPLMALALDLFLLRRPARASLLVLTPWFALVALAAYVAKRLQPDVNLHSVAAWFQRPWIAGDALAFYLHKLLWPVDLAPDMGRTPARVLAGSPLPALALGALGIAGLVFGRRAPRALRGAAWLALAGLAPTLGLVPFAHQNLSTVASRFAYLAMLGPALAVGLCVARLDRRRPALALFGVLLAALGALSFQQAGRWRDLGTIFEHNLRVQPESRIAHDLVAGSLERAGELERAYDHYAAALRLGPDRHASHLSLGNVRLRQGRVDEALAHYEAALEARPDYVKARRSLARTLVSLGRWERAEPHLRALARRSPGDPDLRRRLARAIARQGRAAEAALELEGAGADPACALDLAWLRATASAAPPRDPAAARASAEGLADVSGVDEANRLRVLAAALAAEGDRARALELSLAARRELAGQGRRIALERLDLWLARLRAGELPVDLPPLP